MSDRLTPGPDAKTRIQAHSEADFQSFFDELPVPAMQRVARHLPRIDGFRPTSSLGIARQKTALARKLSKPNATDRDYHGLYLIWREWIYVSFKNAASIQELIDQVEEAADTTQDEETRRLAVDSKIDALFAKLNEDSRQNLCTREQIERFLAFSPLPDTKTAQSMVSASKAASDVEHDTKFNELPERIQRTEDQVRDAAAQVRSLSERIDQNVQSVTQAQSDIRALRVATEQFKQDHDLLRADGQKYAAEQGRLKDAVAANNKTSDTRFRAFSDQFSELQSAIDLLRAQSPDIVRIDDALAKLSVSANDALDRDRASDAALARLQADLDLLTRDLITLSDDRTVNDKLASLMARIGDLESKAARGPLQVGAAPVGLQEFKAGLQWEAISFTTAAPPVAVETIGQIVSAFSTTLQSIGLRKQAAEVFGEECTAAVVSRQAIFLKGAFAGHVARALSASLASSSSIRLSIPVGLESDAKVRAVIADAFSDERPELRGLVIDAVDMVPAQMLRDLIVDCVTAQRGMVSRTRFAVFGTLIDSVASIPIEKGLFEMGPVFDLDVLDWRMSYAGDTAVAAHTLAKTKDQGFWDMLAKETADTDEASRLGRLFSTRRDPAVEQAILRAYKALVLVRKRASNITPLQSLFYGWLLPYWRTRSVHRAQVDDELDGGKVNGSEVDPRLAALLANFPQEASR
ncbi:hypothetical protein [Bradyrhizobium viridifuturi]|uniref:hypothetical protein n=1 Tax=Bradyrhizobium viridifuturi TaxID=1654716 RepID=UPI00067EAAA0|nr:hypothetical protein [Bradyrhizobium viridifuturi]